MTPMQEQFVQEYLVDLNGKQAAIRAGYSPDTAESQASRLLLRNVEVAAAIRAARTERAERTRVDADWLLLRLAEEVEADVADLYDEGGNLKPVKEWPLIWRTGLVAGIETVSERVGEDRNGKPEFATIHKLKLSDRKARLELIGKHIDVQAFKDRVEHSGGVNLTVSEEDAGA